MYLCKPSFEIWEQSSDLKGIYKQIERCGRVCYQSQDKITEDSAKGFVDRMIKSGHGSVLEHGTVYLDIPYKDQDSFNTESFKYETNPYSKATEVPPNVVHKKWHLMVTTNYRALIQNNWLDDLKYICEPTEYHEKRVTVHFICDRSILTEFTRHRTFSFSAESTRYCNYSKDKFNNEITFVIPCWMNLDEGTYKVISFKMIHDNKDLYYVDEVNSDSRLFLNYLITSEQQYLSLLEYGWKPQEARAVLPNALKTELVMTGFVSDWKHFFELRCASNAHPSAQELANPLREEFIKRGYIDK